MNAISYIRNVGKSFGYIAVDVIKDYNPAVTAFAESARDLGSELYQTVSDFKTNMTSKVSEMNLRDEAKSVATEIRSNLFDDLKTGKWYNNDRISKAALAEFEEGFGGFSFNDDDFGDFEFEDDEVDDSTKAEMAQDQMNTRALINSMDVVGAKSANAINTATVRSAEYVVSSQRESSRALYSLTSRGFGEVTKGLSAINNGVAAIASIAEPINIHIQNSTNFYTRSTEYQEKSLSLLEQIAKNTSTTHPASNKSSRQKNTIGDFMMDGSIDLMAYYEMVSNNIKDMVGLYGSFLGGGMGGSIKNSKLVKSPLSTLLKAGVKGLTPKIMKKSMEEFNEYLEGFFATMLGSIRDKNVSNPILAMLKDFLVPKSGYKKDIDTGAYNKGKVDWDGMSRKALMEVIPFQLSQIVSVLTGKPQEIYDYKTGKWVKANTVQKDFDNMKNKYADAAGYEFVSEVKAVLKELKNQNKLTDEQLAKMSGQIDTFNRTAYHSDSSDFIHFAEDGFDFSRYGLDRSTWNVLRAYAKDLKRNGKRSKISRYTGQIMTDRARMGNNMLELEADGSSIYNILHNGATLVDETERGRNLLGVDEYNNDIFYYLQGIYQSTTHLSDNLHLFIPNGRSTKGTKIEKNARITPIRSITRRDRVNASSVEERRNNATDLGSLDAEQLEELLANMNDQTKSGKKLPPKSNIKLREYAMAKYNSVDGNYERDETLERQLEAWEKLEENSSSLKTQMRNSTIGKTIINFSESVLKLLRTPTEAVTSLLSAAEVSMDRLLTGNKEDGEKGILDLAKEGFTGLFESLNDKLNNIFPIDKFKGFMDKIFGAKGEDGKRHGSSLSGFANETAASMGSVGSWFKNIFTGGGVDQAYNGRKVTRSGIVAVSEGELIIPAEYNPFYNKKINKSKQIATERAAIGKFFGSFADGGIVGDHVIGKYGYFQDKDGKWHRFNGNFASDEEIKKYGLGQTSGFNSNSFAVQFKENLRQGGKNFVGGLGEFFERIMPNKDEAKKEKGKISKVVQSALEDLGASKGAMGAGALIGGGVSLLTGGAISPILGAAIGAAGGLIVNSNKVQNALFGYIDDKTGEFQEGLFKKETGEAIKKYVPNVAKGAAIGGLTGLFTGSPIVGALMGSAIGFVTKSENIQKKLFGEGGFGNDGADSGIMSKKTQKKIKAALPNMSIGAIGGLIAGPFGLAGNIMLGSALGYASSTDKFKNWLFGKEDKKSGKREGGFVELLKDKFLTPLVDIFANLGEQIKQSVKHTFHNLSKAMRKVLTDFLKGKIGSKVTRGAKAVGRFANKVTGGLFNKVGDGLVGLANSSKNKSLRKGYNVYSAKLGRNLNAQERLDARASAGYKNWAPFEQTILNNTKLGKKFSGTRFGEWYQSKHKNKAGSGQVFDTYDRFLASATQDEIKDARTFLESIYDPTKQYDDQIRESRSGAQRILSNSMDSLAPKYNTKAYKKGFKQTEKYLLDGNFDEARKWAKNLRMDESSRKALLAEIDKNEKAYSDRNLAKSDSKAARKKLLENSKYRHLFGRIDHISDSDIMSMLDTTNNELKQMNPQEREEKKVHDATVESRDILKNILSVMIHGPEGVDPEIRAKLSPTGKATIREIINDTYNENGIRYKQGDKKFDSDGKELIFDGKEWGPNLDHSATREAIEREENIENAIIGTHENTKKLSIMDNILGFFGKKDDEEKSNLFEDMENFDINLKSVISGLAKFSIGLTGFWAVASGKLDKFFNKLGMGGKAGNETTMGDPGKVDQQGNDLIKGEDGKYYNADGTEYTGEVYADTSDYSRATTPFSSKFLFNEARQLITHGKSFGTNLLEILPFKLGKKFKNGVGGWFSNRNTNLMVNTLDFLERHGFDVNKSNAILDSASSPKGIKGLFSKVKSGFSSLTDKVGGLFNRRTVSNLAEETAENLAERGTRELIEETAQQTAKSVAKETVEEITEQATKKQMMELVQEAVEKLIKNVDNFPFGKKLIKSIPLDKFGKKLIQAIGERVAKASARALADCAYAFPPAGVVLDVIFFITDFIGGWGDATEYFKVLKATTWMKLVSALATSLFGLIPFIGPLIPIGVLVDIIVNVCEACGVDTSELREDQKSATDEVSEYNRVHGTDLDYSDYSKNVAGNKGILEKAWDWSKTQGATNWNIVTTAWSKATSGEYGSSFGDIIKGISGTADDNYKSLAWRTAKEDLELKLRTEMRENGGVDEEKLQQQLRIRIDALLCTEQGAEYYKYEYDESKQSYEDFKKNFETTVLNSHTSSSGQTHGGSGRRRSSSNTSTTTKGYNGMPSNVVDKMSSSTSGGSSGLNNFVSQLDSRYANMNIGGINDVQSKGCGPAAAVMALNQYAGNANMNSAINTAGRYQTGGGTDAAFFADYYSKHGMNASYYDGTTSAGRSNIINNIRNGVPVVLMGSDVGNRSKVNSPFGPNNHYVVASGFDGSGNIIINDPEARRGNKKYSSKILKNVKLGIGMSGAGSRIFRRLGLSGGTTTYSHGLRNDATTQMVWTMLRELGYSDAATAGIMGNLQKESGIQGNNLENNKGNESLGYTDEDYTKAVDDGSYTNFIYDELGFGAAQWTFWERKKFLFEFVKQHNVSIGDLNIQLNFIIYELKNRYSSVRTKLLNATSVKEATRIFMEEYENPADQSEDELQERNKLFKKRY